MSVTTEQVLTALKAVQDPDLRKDLVALGFIKNVAIDGGKVSFAIELTTPACPVRHIMKEDAERVVRAIAGVTDVQVTLTSQVRSSVSIQAPDFSAPKIKNIIPIASGKGGVGKSTVSANLAIALAKSGASVGLMDADVYGPSIPTLLGIAGEAPEVDDKNRITPITKYGLKVMSMGFFMKPEDAVIWRGPMLHKTVQQFLGGVFWGDLDYLIIDLPPGTGDVQLSICQSIAVTGAVIVSTPQDVALNVAQKAIAMFNKLKAPILGVVENMSYHLCAHCGTREDIFGTGGARAIAERLQLPFLGEIPLATSVRVASDAGKPILLSDPASAAAGAFVKAAEALAQQVSIRAMQGETAPQVAVTF